MDIPLFYKITHGVLALCTSLFLFYVWTRHMRLFSLSNLYRGKDYGLLIISIAILFWSLQNIPTVNEAPVVRIFVMAMTNLAALGGLIYFKQNVVNFKNYKIARSWLISVIIVSLGIYFYSIISYTLNPNDIFRGNLFINIFTILTYLILALFAYKIFERRQLKGFGLLFAFSIIIHCIGFVLNQYFADNLSKEYVYCILLITSVLIFNSALLLSLSWLYDLRSKVYSQIYISKPFDLEDSENKETGKSKSEIKKEILGLIMNDKAEEVIERLIFLAENKSLNIDELLLIASNLNRLNTQKLRNTINNDDYTLNRNKINENLIHYTNLYMI